MAASRAARAADKAVEVTGDTAKRQLRAYVRVEQTFMRGVEVGKRPSASIEIKNTGQTPARLITTKSGIGIGLPMGPDKVHPEMMPATDIRGFIARDQTLTHESVAPFDLNEKSVESIRNGSIQLVFFGSIIYEDVFMEKWELTYKFRNTSKFSNEKSVLAICEDGNEERQYKADETKVG